MSKTSLKFRVPLFIVIFSISCVMITGISFEYIVSKNIENNVLNKNLIISRMISDQIDLYLEDAKSTVITAANFSSQSYGDLDQIKREIFRIYDNFNYFDLIFYMNTDAEMVFAKPSNEHVKDRKYADRSYYWGALRNGETTISELIISSVLNLPHFIIGAPVHNKDGDRIGLIGAGVPLSNIKKVVEKTQRHFNGNIWIVDGEGNVAVHPKINNTQELIKIKNIIVKQNNNEMPLADILRSQEEAVYDYMIDGKKYFGAITFVPGVNWMIVVEQDENTVFTETIQLKDQLKLIMMIIILAALIAGLLLVRSITDPIERLVIQVRQWSNGLGKIQPIKIEKTSIDEIGELSRTFADMSLTLNENVKELEESFTRENKLQQYLNNILTSVKSGILVINKEGIITILNREAESITQFSYDEFIDQKVDKFWDMIQLNLDSIINDVMNRGGIFTDIEATIINKLGNEIPVSVSVSQVLDNDKKVIGVVLLFRDISKIKMIEEELKREDRIRSLGQLSASIIHDIGNPLAGMSNLIEILKANPHRGEIEKEVLEVLEKEVWDLNKIVINFLDFCRSSKLEKKFTNIQDLMDGLIRLLKSEMLIKNIQVNKIYPDQPIILKVDRRAIKQAMLNILKNAIQAVEDHGKIHIEIRSSKKMAYISIKDDGVGISIEELENIFNPFFTTKKDGTGLGLSIAYKLIKEHGGKIGIKSEPGQGTEFLVTLAMEE